jgi:uncharacterized protein
LRQGALVALPSGRGLPVNEVGPKKNQEKMKIYQFRMWGRKFAVDTGSGNFFEVDRISSDAIKLLERYPEQDSLMQLSRGYGRKKASNIIRSLGRLKSEGVLFSDSGQKSAPIRRKITDLTLNIVNSCNLSCRYCWNSRGSYGDAPKKERRMGSSVARKAIEVLLKESKGAKDLVVDFYGGEPLLNYSIIKDTVNHCRKIQKKKKVNFRFLLATNGTLLDKDKAEFMIENGVDIAVSLDGSKKVQDMQRPFPGGKGTFDTIMNNLSALKKEYRRRLVGRATFTPYSPRVTETFRFLRSLGFDRIEVCESEKAGYGLDSNRKFFFNGPGDLKRLKSLYYKLARFYSREIVRGKLTYENTYFNRFFKQLSRLYHIQSITGTCSAGFSLLATDMDGSIYPCTAFVGIPGFRIGTVATGVDEKKLALFTNNKISSNKSCGSCWARKLCRGCGSCYNLNYFSNKNLGKPDPYYCDLFRYKTKLMIAILAEVASKNPRLLEEVFIPDYYSTRGKKNGALK